MSQEQKEQQEQGPLQNSSSRDLETQINFGGKIFRTQSSLGPYDNFVFKPRIFWTKNVSQDQIFLDPTFFWEPTFFFNQNLFWTQNFFRPKIFLDPTFLGHTFFLDPKFFRTLICLEPNLFLTRNFLDPKFFFDPKFF